MTRVALYARYSSDQQNAASIEDQMRICREQASREGWHVIATFKDAAISGASVTLRPGIQALLQDAQAGKFDVVMAEALDRISRDQADVATLFKHMQFSGVEIVTLAEGTISELHVGLKGTMNALFLKDLANKTRRGMRGRVEKGKAGGGLCYGYDVVRALGADGESVRGERTINEQQAAVVRRVFADFAAGLSPNTIARALNAEGIPAPGQPLWSQTTLRGHAQRGTGLINNELYIGRLIWNRQRYVKDPRTGKRVSRLNPQSEWITTEVPELRIVDDTLWEAVKARQADIAVRFASAIEGGHTARMRAAKRPKSLLSGLVRCGVCGGPFSLRGQGRFACSAHDDNRSCANAHTITRVALEERVLAGLRERLMAPEIVAEAVKAYVIEANRLKQEQRAACLADTLELERIVKAIAGLVALAEQGLGSRALVEQLLALEAEEDRVRARLAQAPIATPDIHPNIAGIYARKVERLTETLNEPETRLEAAEALRGLITQVILTPGAKRGEIHASLHGEFGTILAWLEGRKTIRNKNTPGSFEPGVSECMVAGTVPTRNRYCATSLCKSFFILSRDSRCTPYDTPVTFGLRRDGV